jgi:hypothetical protein
MRVTVPILATLRSEHRLSRTVPNPLLPSSEVSRNTPGSGLKRPLTERRYMVRTTNQKLLTVKLRITKGPISTLACWYALSSLVRFILDL